MTTSTQSPKKALYLVAEQLDELYCQLNALHKLTCLQNHHTTLTLAEVNSLLSPLLITTANAYDLANTALMPTRKASTSKLTPPTVFDKQQNRTGGNHD